MSDEAAGHFLRNMLSPPAKPGPPYVHTLSAPDAEAAVAWLREQIRADRATAEAAGGERPQGQWAGSDNGYDGSGIVRDGLGETVVYDEGRPDTAQALHIGIHDPQDKIADCEAKLAILDEHAEGADVPGHCQRCITDRRGYPEEWADDRWPCRTVHLVASACRYRDGYREHWGELPAFTMTEG